MTNGTALPIRTASRWWAKWSWMVFVLAGTLVRGMFGFSCSLWNSAPDQIAWGMGLEELLAGGTVTYKQLIHYPHEGGSFLISLMALLFKPLSGIMPPLSWAALALDTFSRLIQIRVARRLFGDRTATWFAAWTVLAAPLMLPWATVNFGLHALMSFAPFLLILQATHPTPSSLRLGLYCGLLASLAYDVWVFAPAYLIWMLLSEGRVGTKASEALRFVFGCAVAFLPHMLIRVFVDHGFGLEDLSPTSIRGLEHDPIVWSNIPIKFWNVWLSDLPASFTLGPLDNSVVRATSLVVAAFIAAGMFVAIRGRTSTREALRLCVLTVASFTVVLAVAPFFVPRADGQGYLYYRYFPFIAPLLVLLLLEAYNATARASSWFRGAWIFGCGIASVVYMTRTVPFSAPNYPATGWVLARKYGDVPEHLMRILDRASPGQRPDLYYGAGWGLSASLFDRRNVQDVTVLAEFDTLWVQFPAEQHPTLARGVLHAFEPGITPFLDQGLRTIVAERISDRP